MKYVDCATSGAFGESLGIVPDLLPSRYDARAYCRSQGGHLPVLVNEDTWDVLVQDAGQPRLGKEATR